MAEKVTYKGREKRKYPRFGFPFYIRYEKDGEKFKKGYPPTPIIFTKKGEKLSMSKDVSIDGICFVAKEKFSPGTQLLMNIFTPIRPQPFEVLAKVAWQKKSIVSSKYLTGICFLDIDDRARFKKLLEMLVNEGLEEINA